MVFMFVFEEFVIGGKDCEVGLVVSSRLWVRVVSVEVCWSVYDWGVLWVRVVDFGGMGVLMRGLVCVVDNVSMGCFV